ncbi:MAG: hypothetical protein IPJ89_00270 [Candidatus Iainarchaeum archaeon]|uniref:Uncharacterized protein n=1 Tax=Candidatus Iainarchaeum sp. TaxID=3101447 RepID=A0A7T9DJU1_9ARCH|nr:MAG: hypothetical protein IPJ89_00270 [Candidatus Diapherotrites archaeon]
MKRFVVWASGLLLVLGLAMLVSAQTSVNPYGQVGIPDPWKHVESGADESTYADGLISWIHFAGSKEHPELDDFRSSYFAHFRLGENASVLIHGEGPRRDWIHALPASPYLPPEGK